MIICEAALKLYSYFRSSASYRVRIALNLKGISHQIEPINLVDKAHLKDDYRGRNVQTLVPALELDDGVVIAQSSAILEWLEECFPQPALLPTDTTRRAEVRSLCQHIACDIHPILNVSVLNYLKDEFTASPAQVDEWYAHWVQRGFGGVEAMLRDDTPFAMGDRPGLAECFLIPQVFNARRFKVDMGAYPRIRAIAENCESLEAFQAAHPKAQPDAQ